MNNETLKMLVEMQEDCVKNASTLDILLDTEDKEKATITLEKAQKLEHDERKLRVEEEKLKLEIDKFNHEVEKEQYERMRQKRFDIVETALKISGMVFGTIIVPVGGLVLEYLQEEHIQENIDLALGVDEITTLSTATGRKVMINAISPRKRR